VLSQAQPIIDVSHFIPARDIIGGVWDSEQAYAAFPRKTIHLARWLKKWKLLKQEYLAIAYEQSFFVLPEINGLKFAYWLIKKVFDRFLWLRKESYFQVTFPAKNILVPACYCVSWKAESITET